MYYKKNLSIYDSTFPFVWVCLLTWWLDRLFVELGHRSSDSAVCIHNDLQYVHVHQYLCATLVGLQIVRAVLRRRHEYHRESRLVDSVAHRCNSVCIGVFQSILVVSWCAIFSVLLDVSPWLCVPWLLECRAVIALTSLVDILATLPAEAFVWDYFLQQGLLSEV